MSTKAGSGYIDIDGKFDKFESGMRSSVSKIGDTVKLGFGNIARIASGILATVGVGKILKDSVAEQQEAIKVTALTNAVIKSTGEAAHISAQGVGDLANALSTKVGVDDEVIQHGENVLLTFTNIKNQVGAGNDIFNQATTASLNLSAALGQDLQSSTIQLGKALNDPIKGVTALQRVGVSFTASQKDQIKTLVASGNVLGAQKVILAELSKEFGGAAEAAATPLDRLKVAGKNAEEALGKGLQPALDSISNVLIGLSAKAGPFVDGLVGGISRGVGKLGPLLDVLLPQIGGIGRTLLGAFRDVGPSLVSLIGPVAQTVVTIGKSFADVAAAVVPAVGQIVAALAPLLPVVAQVASVFVNVLLAAVRPLIPPLVQLTQTIATALRPVLVQLGPIIAQLAPVFGQIGAALAPLVAAFGRLFTVIAPLLPPVAQFFALWVKGFGFLAPFIKLVADITAGIVNFIASALKPVIAVLAVVVAGFSKAVGAVGSFVGAIGNGIAAVGRFAAGVGQKIGEAIGFIASLPGRIVGAVGDLGRLLYNAGKAVIQGLIDGIVSVFDGVKHTLGNLTHSLTSWKGPPDVDAKILFGNGQLVIAGFKRGLESQYESVRRSLGGFTGSLAVGAEFGAGTLAGAGAGGWRGSLTVPVQIDKTTVGKAVVDEAGMALNAKGR